jgi:GT2 family glycosyltransferase
VARNEFLAFTDDDCEPDPGWLPALGRRLHDFPDLLVGGRTVNGLPENPCSRASQFIVEMAYAFYNSDPEHPRFFATNNLALRAELFWRCGGFDGRFRFSEDREFCNRWHNSGLSMAYQPEALVVHRHPLTLASFCRQHFQYGCGAAQFHRICATRHSGRLVDHIGFHLHLSRWWRSAAAASEGGGTPARILPHLALWQIANACGYFYQRVRS